MAVVIPLKTAAGSYKKQERRFREHLEAGIPVLIGWNDWGARWQVAIGYDTMGTEYEGDDVLIVAALFDTTDHNQDGYGVYFSRRSAAGGLLYCRYDGGVSLARPGARAHRRAVLRGRREVLPLVTTTPDRPRWNTPTPLTIISAGWIMRLKRQERGNMSIGKPIHPRALDSPTRSPPPKWGDGS